MSTTILGANGKLGAMLAYCATRSKTGWQTQDRTGQADVIWSGDFNDSTADRIFHADATVINMIGHTGPDKVTLHHANVSFTQELLAKARDTGVAHVIIASSAAVYGAGSGIPFNETDTPQPINDYGKSKVVMEDAALTFAARHSSPAITILRISNVGGADALTAVALKTTADKTPMALHRFADGTAPLRSYIGPCDLFHAMRSLAAPFRGPPRVINVAYPQAVTLDAILAAYRRYLFPGLDWVDTAVPAGIPQRVTLSTDRLRQITDFPVYADPADAIARQIAKVRNQ